MIKERKDSKGNVLKLGEYERKGGIYEYRYKNQDEKWCSVYADKLSQLRALKYGIYMRESIYIREEIRNVTLNDQFDMWIVTKVHLRPNTRADYEYMYNTYVRGGLGREYINEITTLNIKQYYNSLIVNRRIKVETVAHIQNIVFQVFQSAKDAGQLLNNPAERAIKEFKRERSKHTSSRKALTEEQEWAFSTFLKENTDYRKWYPVFYVMVKTGMRIGEIAALRWCDVDFEKQMIMIRHTLVQYGRASEVGGYHIHAPKTEAGIREIPFGEDVVEALKMEKEYQKENHITCNAVVDGYTDFVFLNRFGKALLQSSFNRAMTRLVPEYNKSPMVLEGKMIIMPHITSHTLRHTYATRLCELEINVKVMQRLLGHSDIQTTLSIYTDATQELLVREYYEKVTKSKDTLGERRKCRYNDDRRGEKC